MSNLELIIDSLNYLKDFSINLKVYKDIEKDEYKIANRALITANQFTLKNRFKTIRSKKNV